MEACTEATLELLTPHLSKRMKMLILWTGVGTSFLNNSGKVLMEHY